MITTIILDIGNVLAHFRWDEYLRECGYDEEIIHKVSNASVLSEAWKEFDRGIQKEEELIAQCCAKDPSVVKEITKMFDDLYDLVKEYDYSAEFIQRLKTNGYKVYLLSNYGRRNFQYAKENFEFIKYVDGGIISYEVEHIKPEAEIYETLINKYNIIPKEAIFLDDSQANLDGAEPFGFHTILVKNFDQAVEDLRKLGVKL